MRTSAASACINARLLSLHCASVCEMNTNPIPSTTAPFGVRDAVQRGTSNVDQIPARQTQVARASVS